MIFSAQVQGEVQDQAEKSEAQNTGSRSGSRLI